MRITFKIYTRGLLKAKIPCIRILRQHFRRSYGSFLLHREIFVGTNQLNRDRLRTDSVIIVAVIPQDGVFLRLFPWHSLINDGKIKFGPLCPVTILFTIILEGTGGQYFPVALFLHAVGVLNESSEILFSCESGDIFKNIFPTLLGGNDGFTVFLSILKEFYLYKTGADASLIIVILPGHPDIDICKTILIQNIGYRKIGFLCRLIVIRHIIALCSLLKKRIGKSFSLVISGNIENSKYRIALKGLHVTRFIRESAVCFFQRQGYLIRPVMLAPILPDNLYLKVFLRLGCIGKGNRFVLIHLHLGRIHLRQAHLLQDHTGSIISRDIQRIFPARVFGNGDR